MVKHIYKNLFFSDEGQYFFANGNDRHEVVSEQSYLLVYIMEILLNMKNGETPFLSNEDKK